MRWPSTRSGTPDGAGVAPPSAVRGLVLLCGRPSQLDRPAWLVRSVASPPLTCPPGGPAIPGQEGRQPAWWFSESTRTSATTPSLPSTLPDASSTSAPRTTTADHLALLTSAEQFGADRLWAVEDCRHLSRRPRTGPARNPASASCASRPSSLLTSATAPRSYGKSDPIDAVAVARAALREPDLLIARRDGSARQVRLLTNHRDDLVGPRSSTGSTGTCTNSTLPGSPRPAACVARSISARLGRSQRPGRTPVSATSSNAAACSARRSRARTADPSARAHPDRRLRLRDTHRREDHQ